MYARTLFRVFSFVAVLALVLVAADGLSILNKADGSKLGRGKLVYAAALAGDGAGFSSRYTIGDPTASAITFMKGVVEYKILKPGGNTGDGIGLAPMSSYYAEFDVSVLPGSDVEFWFDLTGTYTQPVGKHLIGLTTLTEDLQLAYFRGSVRTTIGCAGVSQGSPIWPQLQGRSASRSAPLSNLSRRPIGRRCAASAERSVPSSSLLYFRKRTW